MEYYPDKDVFYLLTSFYPTLSFDKWRYYITVVADTGGGGAWAGVPGGGISLI